MKPGISEKFDDEEHDTSPRDYPEAMLQQSKRTMRMTPFDLDALRTESGTRPMVSREEIEQHVRGKIDAALATSGDPAPLSRDAGTGTAEDPHARLTVEMSATAPPPPGYQPSLDVPFEAKPVEPLDRAPAVAEPLAAARPGIPAWAVALACAVVALVAGSIGFVLGRMSPL